MWGESGESLAPFSFPSSSPSPSSEGRSYLSLSQQITFLTEQYWDSFRTISKNQGISCILLKSEPSYYYSLTFSYYFPSSASIKGLDSK